MHDPNDIQYYDPYLEQRLNNELKLVNTDLAEIRKKGTHSFLDFLRKIAEKFKMTFDDFMELFGPLFRD